MKRKRNFLIVLFVCVILLIIYNYSGIELFSSYEKEFVIENQEVWHQQLSFKKSLSLGRALVKLKGDVEGDLEFIYSDGENEWKVDISQQEVNRYRGTSFSYDWYSEDMTVTIKSKKGKIKKLKVFFD
ncbi:hypothetical protein [uncultured Sanguibacteroides sp.]|uniref:hypothetical protein n=1 Tax=uncultured Sanguibacteroides sp. TaxID=1635151 RepID=UPI0025EE1C27|nr:hypothetical protein [uncultured Sanguibacteroides sp.]